MKTKPMFLLLLATAVLTLILIATIDSFSPPGRPLTKLTIAVGRLPQNALIFVAQSRDYFREQGLDVTIQLHVFNKETLDAVLAGRAHMATPGETPTMLAAMRGHPVAIVSNLFSSDHNIGIVARRASGISKPSDLAGKRIGAAAGSTGDYFRYAFLTIHNIALDNVEYVDMQPDEMPAALLAGDVDAVSVWHPHLLVCERTLGRNAVMFGEDIYTQTANLVTLKPWSVRHKTTIAAVLRALMKSEQFIDDKPAEALELVVPYTTVDKAALEILWPNFRFHVNLPQFLLMSLETQARWAMATQDVTLHELPNFLNFFYFDGLNTVAPDRVTVVHCRPMSGECPMYSLSER